MPDSRKDNPTDKQPAHRGFSDDPQKVRDAGRKGDTHANVATDKAEKARIGGQHSHGDNRRDNND